MSNTKLKSVEHKTEKYQKQNGSQKLTVPQQRQLRRTESRLGHQRNHEVLRETQRNRRLRFREWMRGLVG